MFVNAPWWHDYRQCSSLMKEAKHNTDWSFILFVTTSIPSVQLLGTPRVILELRHDYFVKFLAISHNWK